MIRRLLVVLSLFLLAAAPAAASNWPMAGGNASRSGTQGLSAGDAPVTLAWSRAEPPVRTPIVVTESGRVAYGTADGRVHLASLETGATVGPADGIPVVSGTVETDPGDTFGSGVTSLGFADTSTADRHGVIYVVHNDGQGVEIARIESSSGARLDEVDQSVASSFGCVAGGSPVLSPPAAGGSRILFVTLRGSCPADQSLVRIPIEGDASSAAATFGEQTFARVNGLAAGVGPSLAVLNDPQGTPRFYVALGREAGVDFFDAGRGLDPSPSPFVAPADFTVPLAAGEVAMTVSAPATTSGAVAGSEGSGVPPAPSLYVAASSAGQTRVYRLAQSGPTVGVAVAGEVILDSGTPAAALAVSETVAPGGLSAGGRVIVTSANRLTLLRSGDLKVVTSIAGTGGGRGFARTAAATSGGFAFVSTDGAGDVAPRQLALRLDTGALLEASDFAAAAGSPGIAPGQPAIADHKIVFGTPAGAAAYGTSDPKTPDTDPPPVPDCSTTLRGSSAADRLTGGEAGERFLGGRGADRIEGKGGDDCISGGAGNDRLRGQAGDDTVTGGSGRDRLSAGGGRNRLNAGAGADNVNAVNRRRDVVRCGTGRDRVRADRTDRVARDCERVRRVRR